jgi:hypothetical protein
MALTGNFAILGFDVNAGNADGSARNLAKHNSQKIPA